MLSHNRILGGQIFIGMVALQFQAKKVCLAYHGLCCGVQSTSASYRVEGAIHLINNYYSLADKLNQYDCNCVL